MPDLEPITRDEKLWSGEDLEPITRREMYIKHLYDETQVIPENPITREEMFILKAGEELHDVTIEQLNVTENGTYSEAGKAYSPVIVEVPETTLTTLDVTENGTYTAPSGTAYSKVDVDVPLPENAYLLKEIEDVEIATFTDGSALPMPKLEVAIEPIQDLHGYDAPWVGGAGKNKAQPVITTNTTLGGIAFNPIKDNDGNVLGLSVGNGTVNADINQHIAEFYCSESGTYKIIGAKLNGSLSVNKRILLWDNTLQTTTITIIDNNEVSVSLTAEHEYSLAVNIRSSVTVDASELRFMICKDSESSTFAPYSNICPISGWSAVDVNVSGVNIWDEEWEVGQINYSTGNNIPSSTDIRSKNYILCLPNTQYYIKCPKATIICGYDKSKNYVDVIHYNDSNRTFSTLDSIYYIRFCTLQSYGTTYNNDISINYPSTDTEYHAYNPNSETITIQLGDTYYGGTLDVVSGVLTVDRGYIASYNGETLPSTWISDRDVYAEGTTPTIGAEVVYELATPLTIQLSPTQVSSLLGVNNIFADCGEIINGQYFSKGE